MRIEGQHTFGVARALVWKALLDPEVLSKTLPGFQELRQVGENRFEGALDIRVGPVQGRFQGKVALSDLRFLQGYHLELEGTGAPGFVKGEGELQLQGEGDSTTLRYELEAQVGGRIAGVGQRLLDSSARVITKQALEGLEAQLQALSRAEASGEAAAEVRPPSQTRLAGRVVKGVIADLGMPTRVALLVAAMVVIAVVVLLLRGCGG